MLDQNTDRMWYVIGAVLIGAAIIFGANALFPNALASVGDSFESTIHVVDRLINDEGHNMMDDEQQMADYIIHNHSNVYGSTDTSRYVSDGVITVNATAGYGGMYLKLDDLDLKNNTSYRLSYKLKVNSGDLLNIGGHMDQPFANHEYSINGELVPRKYHLKNTSQRQWLDTTEDEYHVDIVFITPNEFVGDSFTYDGRISIQPNRGTGAGGMQGIPVNVDIWDLELVEIYK